MPGRKWANFEPLAAEVTSEIEHLAAGQLPAARHRRRRVSPVMPVDRGIDSDRIVHWPMSAIPLAAKSVDNAAQTGGSHASMELSPARSCCDNFRLQQIIDSYESGKSRT